MKMKMPMLHGWNTDNTAKNHNQSINQYKKGLIDMTVTQVEKQKVEWEQCLH